MKICFIGPANSSHIIKWCNWFTKRGHEVSVISFTDGEIDNVRVFYLDNHIDPNGSDFQKIKYLFVGKSIKKFVDIIRTDIVSVHYATSYGLAVALSGIHDYILSVWGSDIYSFPRKSLLHKLLLKYSLAKSTHLFSTSNAMANEAKKYTKKEFEITPFGVDMSLFNPNKRKRNDSNIVIGTVKTLAELYGIKYFLEAIRIVRNEYPNFCVSVRISGDGPDYKSLVELSKKLKIDDITTFLGHISQEQASEEWANMDIAVIPSISYESFGVAAVEAEASGTAIIISDVEGLKETTLPGRSSIVVPTKDAEAIAKAIISLIDDRELRLKMGEEGVKYVRGKYEIDDCFLNVESLFNQYINR